MNQPLSNVFPFVPFPDKDKAGKKIKNTSSNLAALLRSNGWEARYNGMMHEFEVLHEGEIIGGCSEGQHSILVSSCSTTTLPDKAIADHLPYLCKMNTYHPVIEYLENGPAWDGTLRLKRVLDAIGAKYPNYAEKVMISFLIGAVASIYETAKGEKFLTKLLPILCGDQSAKKSALMSRLFSVTDGSYLSAPLDPSVKDSIITVTSAWVVEIAEVEQSTKKNIGLLKAFITRDEDVFRAPYGKRDMKKPRQTSFIGSANGTHFLRDETGSSRFAVIDIKGQIDIETINQILGYEYNNGRIAHKEPELLRQFWLEVKARYDAGESWHLDQWTLAKAAELNDQHEDKGSQYETICQQYLGQNHEAHKWMTAKEVSEDCRIEQRFNSKVGRALARLAKEKKIESKKIGGNVTSYHMPVSSQLDPKSN